jgi:hypothetical protein
MENYKIVAYLKLHIYFEQYQDLAVTNGCQQSEYVEGKTHYAFPHYHYSGCQ